MPTPPSASGFAAWLCEILAEDPARLEWPREFRLEAAGGELPGLYDPHNALLVLYDLTAADFADPALRPVLAAGDTAPGLCSRLLVFARRGEGSGWSAAGFTREAEVPGFWADGGRAVLLARTWGRRASVASAPAPPIAPRAAAALPRGWRERAADPDDAPPIRRLLGAVFPAYPIPEDPAVIRYALAGGLVRGRVVVTAEGALAAYASAEFQPGGGAPEITDCATAPAHRGRGLMGRVVTGLLAELAADGGPAAAYALAREDRPAMARVLARAGWRRTGRLCGHYRVGAAWVTAGVWVSPTVQA